MQSTGQSASLPALLSSRVVKRSPIFYGWIIAAVATLGMIMTSPGQTYSVSIFIEHFIADLGISRSMVSTLYTIGTLVGSFALPIVGRQIDQRGARFMVVLVSLIFGLACIFMGFVQNALMLVAGFIAIRMMGQGSLGLISQYTINQWWVKRRGSVMGMSNLLVSLLGLGIFPTIIYWLISQIGWRATYPLLGVLVLAVMVPVGYLFFREQPERYGLDPDGRSRRRKQQDRSSMGTDAADDIMEDDEPEENWTLTEALHTPVFWIVVLGISSVSMLSTGLMFHIVSIFQDNGLPNSAAATAFVPVAVTTAIVTLGGGILVDRIPVRLVLATGLILQVLSLVMAYRLTGVGIALIYGIILGATTGTMRSVSSVVWANYFGRKHLGSINGTAVTITIASSALGPMPLGIARDLLGSYNLALNVAAIIPFFLAIAALFVNKPQK